MAVPKRRTSTHRKGRRRANHKVKIPEIVKCTFCGALKKPHFVCPVCGKKETKKNQENISKDNESTKKSRPKK